MAKLPVATPGAPDKNKPGKKRAPENETSREKFVRIASLRVTNAVETMKLIGQIGLSPDYEYSPEDAAKIVTVIKEAANDMAEKLVNRKAVKTVAKLFD